MPDLEISSQLKSQFCDCGIQLHFDFSLNRNWHRTDFTNTKLHANEIKYYSKWKKSNIKVCTTKISFECSLLISGIKLLFSWLILVRTLIPTGSGTGCRVLILQRNEKWWSWRAFVSDWNLHRSQIKFSSNSEFLPQNYIISYKCCLN